MTVSAIQSVALVGVYQWTASPPNSGWTSNCSIGWMLKPLPPASSAIVPSVLRLGPCPAHQARLRRVLRCTSSAVRSIVRTPAAKPRRANTTRKTGRVPRSASSP